MNEKMRRANTVANLRLKTNGVEFTRAEGGLQYETIHMGMKLETLEGSFSAVSTPIFPSKYSLESSRRDLHNALLCTVLQSQNFSQKSSTFFRE